MNDTLIDFESNKEEQHKKVQKIFLVAVNSTVAAAFFGMLISMGKWFCVIPLGISFVLVIYGFVMLTSVKNIKDKFLPENKHKLFLAKIFLWISLAAQIISLLTFLSLLVYLGMYGFSR